MLELEKLPVKKEEKVQDSPVFPPVVCIIAKYQPIISIWLGVEGNARGQGGVRELHDGVTLTSKYLC